MTKTIALFDVDGTLTVPRKVGQGEERGEPWAAAVPRWRWCSHPPRRFVNSPDVLAEGVGRDAGLPAGAAQGERRGAGVVAWV